MATTDKNIVITPNIGQNSDPKIAFSGANTAVGAQTINLNVYPNDGGTISFEGSSGQLFSITNKLTGTLFSVNDVSGIPSIEVLDTGTIRLAQYGGNVGIGIAAPVTKLETYATVNSLQIVSSVRNDQAGSGVAAIGFNVSSSAAADTSAVKAGIGLIRQSPQGVGQINFYNRVTQDTSSFTASDIRGSISAGGIWSLGAAPGSESLRITPVASSVNYLEAKGAATGGNPNILATGSDTNVNFIVSTKGIGALYFQTNTNGSNQFIINHTASAVNQLSVTGGATGVAPVMSVTGSDTNIDITLTPKGTGKVNVGILSATGTISGTLKGVKVTLSGLGTLTTGTTTIDLATAQVFTATIPAANTITIAFSNAPAAGQSQVVLLRLTNAGSGTIVWPASTKFTGGTAPTLTASGVDVLGVYYDDTTTTYMVFVIGLNVKVP